MDNTKLLNKYRKLTGDVIYECVIRNIDYIETIASEVKFSPDLFRTWETEQLPPDQRDYNLYDANGDVVQTASGRDKKKRRIISVGTKAKMMLEYLLCAFAIECNAFGVPETDQIYGEFVAWSRQNYRLPITPIFIEIWTRYRDIVEPFWSGDDYTEWIMDELDKIVVSNRMREIYANVVTVVIHAIAVQYARLKWEAKTPFHERAITALLVNMTATMDYDISEELLRSAKEHKKDEPIDWLPDKCSTPDPNHSE